MRCASCEHVWHAGACEGAVLVERSINGHVYETFVRCECAGPEPLAPGLA